MRKVLEGVVYGVPAVIHLLPLYGLLGAGALTALYGVDFADPSLQVLMRHRAVLFGIVGALLVLAAFRPAYQTVAAAAGFVSMLSFVAIAWLVGDVSPVLRRIAVVDLIGSAALGLGLLLRR